METCPSHIQLFSDVQVIKNTTANLDKKITEALGVVSKHIDAGSRWRLTIVGVAATMIINIILAAFWYGQVAKQIQINTERIIAAENFNNSIRMLLGEQKARIDILEHKNGLP